MKEARHRGHRLRDSISMKHPEEENLWGESRPVVDRDWGQEKWVATADVYGMSFGSDEHVLKLDGGDVCTAP